MLDRRAFSTLLAGAALAPKAVWAQGTASKTVLYSSAGPDLTLYDIDVEGAMLTRRSTVTLPGNVQYAWPHPNRRFFYVTSTNGEPGGGARGNTHTVTAFRIDSATGALAKHGGESRLPARPIHNSVDESGRFLLIAYNDPSGVTIHRINDDGTIGAVVEQKEKLDSGIYGHQIRTTPGNKSVILITRGNNATPTNREDPGAIKVYGFDNGQLRNLQSITPDGQPGYSFGPRHLDFHPTKPWLYVSIERQNQIQQYQMTGDGSIGMQRPVIKTTLSLPRRPEVGQGAGTIHLHPNGRFAYIPNRASGTVKADGKDVWAGGENTIAVFALDERTGEPTAIQHVEGHGVQLRTFAIHPSARLLVAASIQPILMRDGAGLRMESAGMSVYRMGEDGKLTYVRKYDVDTAKGTQFWSGMVTL